MSRRLVWLAIAVAALAILAVAWPLRGRIVTAFEHRVLGIGVTPPIEIGRPFPALSFEALDGTSVKLPIESGHVTFVNVFATWCPPCKTETPDLEAFAKSERGKGVDVVGVDRQETPAAVNAFRAAYHLEYPMVIDTGRTTQDVLGARIIPRTIVIDANGIIRSVVSGPLTRDRMDRLAAQAAAGS